MTKIWHPVAYEQADVQSIQTMARYAQGAELPWPKGEEPPVPSPYDVKRLFDWLINRAAMTYDNGFVDNDPNGRIGAFIDGRQSVGQQLVKVMKLKATVFDKDAE